MELFILKFRNFLNQKENKENGEEIQKTRKLLDEFLEVQMELEEKIYNDN